MFSKRVWIPLVLGGIIEICLVGMWGLNDLGAQIPTFFLFYGVASVAYCVGIWQKAKFSVSTIWLFAVLFRLTLLFTDPSLSDDIFRYLWDGRVLASGINPYLYPPESEFLTFLRDGTVYPYINHPQLPTIYPPVAQFFFLIAFAVFGSVWGLKLMVVAIDMALGWGLLKLLDLKKRSRSAVLIYLWHPLILIEGAGSGHMDFLGIMVLILALWAWYSKRDLWAVSLLGGAVLAKFLPVVFIPALVRWSKWWFPKNWTVFFLLPVILAVGYIPFVVMEGPLWGSLGTYAANWEFNSPVFWMLRRGLGDGLWARKVLGGLFLCIVCVACVRRLSPLRFGYVVMACFMLMTPTLHPWYLVWLIPFLVFYPNSAWIGFSIVVVLSYEVLIDYRALGVWEESNWIWGIEFGTLFIVGIVSKVYRWFFDTCKS
jgi:hypothetical protein